jgi:hypothetical protein
MTKGKFKLTLKWFSDRYPDKIVRVEDRKKYIMIFMDNMRVRISK